MAVVVVVQAGLGGGAGETQFAWAMWQLLTSYPQIFEKHDEAY